ncbi:hypothetical protein [Acuticoccus sp. I52.16.1]|uniref:hypothetical protein n=1 Tax=Acuticoccus sp. I52.16.1 TaxID=2928472 RepID=UPI001FD62B92|nr:hypothetical protein [Acuticoccus sp. I52.16.1]UOM34871.1 hypothetical protein MRB58_01270 [Acuticoccus sp. I52.16.1]
MSEAQETGLDRVERAIREHLPARAIFGSDERQSNKFEALALCNAAATAIGADTFGISKEAERAKLNELLCAARAMGDAYRSLSSGVRMALWDGARQADPAAMGTRNIPSPLVIPRIAALVEAGLPAAREAIESAQEKGRRNTRAAAVVGEARAIWQRRTGKALPAKQLDEATPFALFLADVLDALDCGKPRSAYRAWAALHSSDD